MRTRSNRPLQPTSGAGQQADSERGGAPLAGERQASLAPPEEREAYLAFLRATQRPQGWAALEQPWPGQSLPDVPRTYVLCTATQREMAARLG